MTQNPKNPPSGDRGRTETTVPLRTRALTSRAAAVKQFCLDCVGGVRADVRDCTSQDCALYPHRPYRVRI